MHDRKQIEAKREAARSARRLAWGLTLSEDRKRVLAFAAELENQANALEADSLEKAGKAGVTQIQMQVQQGPAANDDREKDKDRS